ncbi:MAG TPA: type II toxin-antitoxin system VapC family toxin [Candidatus Lokiarchaeia archaeon]|nr:type II toxin-antitoxin system VapC family toxin [Candidatus Lokiarchaeia archaeon]
MIAQDSSTSGLVYIDTYVFLNYILYDPQLIPQALVARQFLEQVKDRQVNACTSLLTWDELVWVVRKELTLEDARQQGLEFLDFPWLQFLNVTKDIVKKAQDLIEASSLKPRDAIHIASALIHGASEFITFDADLINNSFIPCRILK